ncbi:hypothetical protein ACKVWC_010484 [Pyricularia oryzae]
MGRRNGRVRRKPGSGSLHPEAIRDVRAGYVKDLKKLDEGMRRRLVEMGALDQTIWEPDAITHGEGQKEDVSAIVSKNGGDRGVG